MSEYREVGSDEIQQQNENALRRAIELATAYRDRGESQPYKEGRPLDEYIRLLPYLGTGGKTEGIIGAIQKGIQSDGEAQVLDIGSGNNPTAMDEIISRFNGKAHTIGLTAPASEDERNTANTTETGTTVVKGEMIALLEQMVEEGRQQSVITSVETFRHLSDPLRALELAYQLLKPNGVLLINDIRFEHLPIIDKTGETTADNNPLLRYFYQTFGEHASIKSDGPSFSLALRKIDAVPELQLPIKRVAVEDLPPSITDSPRWKKVNRDIVFTYQYEG
jgi:2-polyprenyl-3-methyl-5-hydroxy-6-metoxy-1,4-benzoquinol methylase